MKKCAPGGLPTAVSAGLAVSLQKSIQADGALAWLKYLLPKLFSVPAFISKGIYWLLCILHLIKLQFKIIGAIFVAIAERIPVGIDFRYMKAENKDWIEAILILIKKKKTSVFFSNLGTPK